MLIVSLGDLILDIIVQYDPTSGEVDTGPDAVRILPGGSAANFAAHAARQGAIVRFISKVGEGWEGDLLVSGLLADGVEPLVQRLPAGEASTGRVLVMVDARGQRRMWSYPGASGLVGTDQVEPEVFTGAQAFHLTGYSLLREGPRPAAEKALALAREAGALLTLDPNPAHLITAFGPSAFRDYVARLGFDVLFPNEEEGSLLTGAGDPEAIALGLLEVAPLVVLTLGERGCIVAEREAHSPVSVPGYPVERVVDVTGAGDAFAAGFVVEYLVKRDPYAAAIAGNRLAAAVTGKLGGR